MYQHNGITYLSEEEYLLAEPELLRKQNESKQKRKTLLIVLSAILLIIALFLFMAFDLVSNIKKNHPTHPQEEGSSCISSSYSPA